jgi:hypothetical protein
MARLAVAVAALAAVALLVASLRDHDRCAHARATIFSAALGRGGASGEQAAIADLRATCRGTSALVDVAGALHVQRRDREALALAREAAAREPRNAAAWRTIVLTGAQAPALARAAERRLRALDPLGRASLNRSARRSTR